MKLPVKWICLLGLSLAGNAQAEIFMDGDASIEQRLFFNRPSPELPPDKVDSGYPYPVYHQISLALSPSIYYSPDHSNLEYTVQPFVRLDERDDDRTHFDFRELKAGYVSKEWRASLGFDQVHWGVMENYHLVDIVNQTDYTESPSGEDKLGQPMARFALLLDDAVLETYLLIGYREPLTPSEGARLNPMPDHDYEYEGWGNEWHPDVAVRYEKTLKNASLGVSYFGGHNRMPELKGNGLGSDPVWYVDLINQASLDAKLSINDLELKGEVLYRVSEHDSTRAIVAGLEYQFASVAKMDVSFLSEYSWDQRGKSALGTLYQNDIFAGLRMTFPERGKSEILIGQNYDFDYYSQYGFIEANYFLADTFSIGLEVWWFDIKNEDSIQASYSDDDMIQLTAFYHF